jgi:hypothetical protein
MIHPDSRPAQSCRFKSRLLFGAGLLVLAGLLFWSMATGGALQTWDLLGVPTMVPSFADARVITAGAESAARGFDPLIENPADPYDHRPMNYPRIWQLLFHLDLTQRDTAMLAGVFISLFLFGLLLVMRDASGLAILLQLLCLTSPAVCLCIERGNNDLVIFFVVALAVVALEYRPWFSAVCVGLAFLLKLYPIVTLVMFLKLGRKSQWRIIGILGLGAAAYLLIQHREVSTVLTSTPVIKAWAYSNTFLIKYLLRINGNDVSLTEVVAPIATALLLGVVGWVAWLQPAGDSRPSMQLAAFRAGTAIYAMTFCIHPSGVYRLIFVLFVIPQLVEWVQEPAHKKSRIAGITLLAAIISLWAMRLPRICELLPSGVWIGWVFSQFNYWILLAGLVYLGINTVINPRPGCRDAAGMASLDPMKSR